MFIQKIQKSPPGVELMPLLLSGDVFLGKFAELTGTVFEIEYRITFFAKKKCAFWKSSTKQDKQSAILTGKVEYFYHKSQNIVVKGQEQSTENVPKNPKNFFTRWRHFGKPDGQL